MHIDIEEITPSVAEGMLGHNLRNRHVQEGTVARYTDLMRRGLWSFDGAPIRFAEDGRLLDGQYRLLAIVSSVTTQSAVVIRGLNEASQEVMDTGRKRTLSGALSMRGVPSAIEVAALVPLLVKWENGQRGATLISGAIGVEIPAAIEYFEEHRDEILQANRVAKVTKVAGGAPGRVVSLSAALFARIHSEDAEVFFEKIRTGAELGETSPILHLRSAAFTASRDLIRPEHYLALIIKAWNAFRTGAPVSLLMYRPGGAKPERFPEPI